MSVGHEVVDPLHAANKLGGFLDAFAKAKQILEAAARIEVETVTATARRDSAIASAKKAENELAQISASIASAVDTLAETERQVKVVQEATQSEAQRILEGARNEADKILETARGELSNARNKSSGVIARAAAAERQLKTAQDELVTVEARIEQAKVEARKIFGS